MILVTGACGQLGFDLIRELASRAEEAAATDILPDGGGLPASVRYIRLDLSNSTAVRAALEQLRPDAVIHCAGWTAVDAAEEPENREKVFAVNAQGTRNLAEACKAVGAKMLYISTDYIFDGTGTEPWQPDCEAYAPLNVYGLSKLEGELAVKELLDRYFIVRIAWAFGKHGVNFVRTMLRVGQTRSEVRVVNDQIGTPTYTLDLARLLVDMIQTERYGVYHATNEGPYISWYEYACEIYQQAGLNTKVIPVTTAEYGLSKARRPHNSRLDRTKLAANGFQPLPEWKDALRRFLKTMDLNDRGQETLNSTQAFRLP